MGVSINIIQMIARISDPSKQPQLLLITVVGVS